MNKLTVEEIYREMREYFTRPNAALARIENSDESVIRCYYRAPGGLKCAFGCLFSDDEYDPNMEDRPADEVIGIFASLERFNDPELIAFIVKAQYLHDRPSTRNAAEFVMLLDELYANWSFNDEEE